MPPVPDGRLHVPARLRSRWPGYPLATTVTAYHGKQLGIRFTSRRSALAPRFSRRTSSGLMTDSNDGQQQQAAMAGSVSRQRRWAVMAGSHDVQPGRRSHDMQPWRRSHDMQPWRGSHDVQPWRATTRKPGGQPCCTATAGSDDEQQQQAATADRDDVQRQRAVTTGSDNGRRQQAVTMGSDDGQRRRTVNDRWQYLCGYACTV